MEYPFQPTITDHPKGGVIIGLWINNYWFGDWIKTSDWSSIDKLTEVFSSLLFRHGARETLI